MSRSVLVHTTDPELYLVLRYVLQEAGHRVEIISNIDQLKTSPEIESGKKVVVLSLAPREMLKAAQDLQSDRVRFDLVGLPLVNTLIGGRDTGLFDFLVERPFDPMELLRFISASELSSSKKARTRIVQVSDIEIDPISMIVTRGPHEVPLSALHFRLLSHLAAQPQRVVTRQELIETCWPAGTDVEPRTVDIHIGRIRTALSRYGDDIIRTVRGRGYAIR